VLDSTLPDEAKEKLAEVLRMGGKKNSG
jgi:hypothetical protein